MNPNIIQSSVQGILNKARQLWGGIGHNVQQQVQRQPIVRGAQMAGRYFNPTQSGTQGFWGTPAAQWLGRAQQFVESPKPFQIPEVKPFNNNRLGGQIGNFGVNAVAQIAGAPLTAGANILSDYAQQQGRKLGGRVPTSYENLKAPVSRLEYNLKGIKNTPQEVLGNIAGTGADVLALGFPTIGGNVGRIAESKVGQGMFRTVLQEAHNAGKIGALYSGLLALSEGRKLPATQQLTTGAQAAGTGYVGGAILGGTIASSRYLLGAIKNGIRSVRPDLSEEQINKSSQRYIRDEVGRFVGVKKGEKFYEDPYLTKEDVKRLRTELGLPDRYNEGAIDLKAKIGLVEPTTKVGKNGEIKAKLKQTKLRGFPEQVATTPDTPPELRKAVLGESSNYYTPTTNKETISYVNNKILNKGEDYALKVARSNNNEYANATSQLLIQKYLKEGSWDKADILIKEVSPRFTRQGQQTQILSLYGRLTPTGATRYAQHLLDQVNANRPRANQIELTPEVTQRITEAAGNIKKFPEGSREQIVAIAQLMREIAAPIPPSIGQKVAAIQTMAQLLNPKTAIRNTLGNAIFAGAENVSDVLATGLDKGVSIVTGSRSKTLPSLPAQGKGLVKGFREGMQDVKLGIDTSGVGTKYDLPTKTFQKGFLSKAEKLLNIELRATDRAAYQAAFEGSIKNQMKIAGVSQPTENMLQVAHGDALYRTFQDNSTLAQVFTGTKKLLNKVGTPDGKFGLGDFILKYPKTPANLLSRALDYSPVGYLKGLYQAARPVISGAEFNQKQFVETLARGTVGTGILTTGYMLAKNGVITGRPEKDKDIAAMQRTTGTGGFRINVDALKRYVLTGKPQTDEQGDKTVTYDWAQPISLALGMGANFANNPKGSDAFTAFLNQLDEGTSTLTQQSLVKGVTGFTTDVGRYGPVRAFSNAVLGSPSGFVPSLSNQVVQIMNNQSKDTYDPNVLVQAFNKVKARIPVAEQTLPTAINTQGQPQERYQGGTNNLFNVFLNPAFIGTIDKNPTAKEVLDLFERSGETQQAPKVVPTKVNVNGQEMVLTPQQKVAYQQYIGQRADWGIQTLMNMPDYNKLTDAEKAQEISNLLANINSAAKIELFGDNPKSISAKIKAVRSKDLSTYKSKSSGLAAKVKTPKAKKTPKLKAGKKLKAVKMPKYKIPSSSKFKVKAPKLSKIKLTSGSTKARFKMPKIETPSVRPLALKASSFKLRK